MSWGFLIFIAVLIGGLSVTAVVATAVVNAVAPRAPTVARPPSAMFGAGVMMLALMTFLIVTYTGAGEVWDFIVSTVGAGGFGALLIYMWLSWRVRVDAQGLVHERLFSKPVRLAFADMARADLAPEGWVRPKLYKIVLRDGTAHDLSINFDGMDMVHDVVKLAGVPTPSDADFAAAHAFWRSWRRSMFGGG